MTDNNPSDIHRITLDGREIILVGTAHISQESVETVCRVIEEDSPDTVCVELDHQRHQALKDRNRWESLNIIQVIRNGQATFLLANLALASFQKRLGLHTGVKPGAELAAAADEAETRGMNVSLIDREIRTTLMRAWRKAGFWNKMKLLAALLGSLFENQELDEEELARLRQTDTLSVMLEEMGSVLPAVKTILVDERDTYMAHQIKQAPGNKIAAVVGAAHLPGILRNLNRDIPGEEIDEISEVPPKTRVAKAIPWMIPALVIALFIAGFFFGDRQQVADAALAWVLANGLLSALGTLIALGHPVSVATAFVAAPITSLNPTIGAGFVTGLVQAFVAAPTVRDLEQVGDDMASIKGWWKNRMIRVLLVFVFSSLGSGIGTFVALGWLKNLL